MYRLGLAHDSSVATALVGGDGVAGPTRAPAADIVGRDLEMDALLHEFERAQRGQGGWSSLRRSRHRARPRWSTRSEAARRSREAVRIGRGRCSERLAGSEAYLPILEVLDSLQSTSSSAACRGCIRALAPSWYVQIMPPSDNDSSAARLAADTAGGSQERLKRESAALLEELSRLQPSCCASTTCTGPIHRRPICSATWPGGSTRTRLLIIATCRPVGAGAGAPSVPAAQARSGRARDVPGDFARALNEAAIARYLAMQFPEHAFPADSPGWFTSAPRAIRSSWPTCCATCGGGSCCGSRTAVDRSPTICRRSSASCRSRSAAWCSARSDALDDADRRLLGAASVQGIDFDTAMLAAVLELLEEDVEDRLDRLEREHALVRSSTSPKPPIATLTLRYRFAHHLYHHAFDDRCGRPGAPPSAGRSPSAWLQRSATSRATAPRTSRCCSSRHATTCAPPSTGTARRRPRRGCTRTTRRRGSRARTGSARRRAGRPSTRRRRARPANDLRPGDEDRAAATPFPRSARPTRGPASSVPPGRGSGACRFPS